jgi:integrase/recombinase XerD
MSSFKVLLDKRRSLKDGSYPLIVRIYNGQKFRDINLKIPLQENQFDSQSQKVKANHPNNKLINQKIKKTLLEVQDAALNMEIKEEDVTAKKIRAKVVRTTPKLNFIQYGSKISEDMRQVNRLGNATAYRDAISALKTYSGRSEIQFTEITYEFLCQIENKMLAGGLKRNSIAAYNRAWRAVFNKAINENLVESKYYPYRKYKIKGEGTAKRNITKEDIAAIANVELKPNSELWQARNYFMLSFYLRGISFMDMAFLKKTDIRVGKVSYRRKKTHKLYNIKLTSTAQEIINLYTVSDSTYILPVIPINTAGDEAEERKHIQYWNKTTNKYLKKLGKELKIELPLTTYVARHSWATIAKKMGYSKDLIAEALGHEFGNKVTGIYLDNFDQEVIDDMNEKVSSIS